ncbi:scavenger receptor activity [Chamberlinius hualienensis]
MRHLIISWILISTTFYVNNLLTMSTPNSFLQHNSNLVIVKKGVFLNWRRSLGSNILVFKKLSKRRNFKSGILAIENDNRWAVLCAYNWDIHMASMACKELGFKLQVLNE